MRALIQRVDKANVKISGEIAGEIGRGLVILLGIKSGDTESDLKWLAEKCINLRIFEDDAGKFNLSLLNVQGSVLVISQFTLFGDCRRGRRPGFTDAAPPEIANAMYKKFIVYLNQKEIPTQSGEFAAHMLVEIHNNGPVTLMIDTEDR